MIVDAGMTGNMKYYTGLIFKAYVKEAGSAVISGGRYDGLLGELGADCPAAGFAIDVDGMLKAAMKGIKQPRERKILVAYSSCRFVEAMEYSEKCRKGGKTVNLIYCSDISDFEQYRKQYRYDEIIIFE
jgi:ATP phosphoribosyltransferase regulatory subunit